MAEVVLSRRLFTAIGVCALAGGSRQNQSSTHVPWLADVQRPPKTDGDSPRLTPLLIDAQGRPIDTPEQWQAKRQAIRERWLAYLGMWQNELGPPKVTVLTHESTGSVVRELVRYPVEPGIEVEAYLIRPAKISGKVPGVAVFHSTVDHTIRQPAGLGSDIEKAWALRLAERGMVTLAPRNFLWTADAPSSTAARTAEFHKRRPGAKGMAKMLSDAQRAVDVLASLPEVDPQRLGSAGHSLGAKEVLYLAAFDERVRATVFSEGGIGINFSNWNAQWYLGKEVESPDFRGDHHELLALAAPRPMLIIGGDSADGAKSWPYVAAALQVYSLYGKPAPLGLFNHGQGHAVPKEAEDRTYQWLETYLA